MRVICPHCQKSVTLADTAAEQPTPCPACSNIFTAPALMAVAAMPEPALPPTPKVVEPTIVTPPPPVPTTSAPATTVVPGGVQLRLTKNFAIWLGPVGFLVYFVLTFFNWVGSYPGGYPAYSQSAWQVMTSYYTLDRTGDEVVGRHEELEAVRGPGWLMWLAMLVTLPAVAIALLDLFEEFVTVPIPDVVKSIWPHRRSALFAASSGILFLIAVQWLTGMGLMSFANQAVDKKIAATAVEASKADPATVKKEPADVVQQKQAMTRALEIGHYAMQYTTAFRLAMLALVAGVVGFGLELWLVRRGTRPEPRLELHW